MSDAKELGQHCGARLVSVCASPLVSAAALAALSADFPTCWRASNTAASSPPGRASNALHALCGNAHLTLGLLDAVVVMNADAAAADVDADAASSGAASGGGAFLSLLASTPTPTVAPQAASAGSEAATAPVAAAASGAAASGAGASGAGASGAGAAPAARKGVAGGRFPLHTLCANGDAFERLAAAGRGFEVFGLVDLVASLHPPALHAKDDDGASAFALLASAARHLGPRDLPALLEKYPPPVTQSPSPPATPGSVAAAAPAPTPDAPSPGDQGGSGGSGGSAKDGGSNSMVVAALHAKLHEVLDHSQSVEAELGTLKGAVATRDAEISAMRASHENVLLIPGKAGAPSSALTPSPATTRTPAPTPTHCYDDSAPTPTHRGAPVQGALTSEGLARAAAAAAAAVASPTSNLTSPRSGGVSLLEPEVDVAERVRREVAAQVSVVTLFCDVEAMMRSVVIVRRESNRMTFSPRLFCVFSVRVSYQG